MRHKNCNNAKGIVLIIILMLVAMITIVGLGFIVRGDTELLCGQNMEMAADMSYLAESGLEQAKGLIMCPQGVATEYWTGATAQQLAGGTDFYDVSVTKQSDLDWQITSSAYRQMNGKQIAQNSITADLRLDPAIAFWSGTGVLLTAAANITGDTYCNGVLTNWGSINGDCFVDSLTGNSAAGAVKAKTDLQLAGPTINSSILVLNWMTQTLSGSSITGTALSGSQVYYRNADFELKKNVIINGCLAVDGNLTVSDTGNVINAQKNVPAIYVSGNLIIKENAALDCNGLVFVDGRVEAPICNRTLNVTGSLFTDDGIRHILPDYSSNGYDGIVNGDCAWVSGVLGGALNFDGSGDFIDIGNPAQLNIDGKISITAFIKVNAFDKDSQAIVTKGNTSWRLQRYASTNYIEFVCTGVTGGSIHGSKNVNDGLWHHIAAVHDNGGMSLYVDGLLDAGQFAGGNINLNSAPVYIGENSELTGKYFNGSIDDVRIYKKALLPLEILSIISGGSPASGNRVGWWQMDGGNCSTIIAASPAKAAIYHWPNGAKDRWSPAAGAFYKSIARNP